MLENTRHGRIRSTASDFGNWVFEFTHPKYQQFKRESAIHNLQEMGRAVHQWIESIKQSVIPLPVARDLSSNWELVYSDPHDGTDERLFMASCLIVDGEAMRCKPDVVFRDKQTGCVIVVEREGYRQTSRDYPPGSLAQCPGAIVGLRLGRRLGGRAGSPANLQFLSPECGKDGVPHVAKSYGALDS